MRMLHNSSHIWFFCFHHAGGTHAIYQQWKQFLPKNIQLVCLGLPRLSASHVFQEEIVDTLLDDIATDLLGRCGNNPFVLFGHCMGGLLAYRLAAKLEYERGCRPLTVVISASCPPGVKPGGGKIGASEASFWELLYDLIHLGAMPKELAREEAVVRQVVNTYRNDLKLMEHLSVQPVRQIDAPIIFVGGKSDIVALPDSANAWRDITRSGFAVELFDGAHFYFIGNEQVVLEKIINHLYSISDRGY
jgi:external thioesterase TEII